MKKILLYLGIAIAAIGCTKDPDIDQSVDTALTITSNIATRVTGNSWDDKDAIGVYVTSTDDATAYGVNVQYTTTSSGGATLGNFTSTDPIYPPSSGAVKIFSYYPYLIDVDLTAYPINSKAENQVDLLSVEVTETINPASASVNLIFVHKLSKISLTIVADGGITLAELEDVGVTISNVSTSGTFNLKTSTVNSGLGEKGVLDLKTTTTKEENTVTAVTSSAIVIPQSLTGDTQTLTFTTTDGSVFTADLTTTEFEVGMQYEYTATINDTRVDITTTGIKDWEGSDNDPTVGNASLADITYKDDIYYISSAKGLAAFRDLVNGADSNTEGATIVNIAADYFDGSTKPSINGKLMKEIDLSEISYTDMVTPKNWIPIGNTSAAAYTGKFDGDGHKVSGLYIGTGSKLGLFGYLGTDGLICNVGVAGEITTTSTEVAGIVAWNKGWVMNCYSEVNLNKGNDLPGNNVGGIAGYNEGNVVNCYNTGYVKGASNVGGIVGQNIAGGYVGYSFSVGEIVGTSRYGGIVGWNYETTDEAPTIKGCFCLDNTDYSIGQLGYTSASGSYDGNMYDADYFKSDVFVYIMNNGAATYNKNEDPIHDNAPIDACAWVDNTDDEEYPTLNFGVTPEYNDEDYDIIYNSGVYEINTADGLKAFAALVNNGGISTEDGYLTLGNFDTYFSGTTARTSINGKLMENITLTGDWTPIGEKDGYTYSGTFDGNGKLVSGLSVPTTDAAGLFGIISGTISNLGVTGGTVRGTSAGGVVGNNNGGTVINCYNAGCTVTGNSHIGGVVGYVDSDGVVVNCYNAGAVTAKSSAIAGGVVGGLSGGSVTNCYNAGCVSDANSAATYRGGVIGQISGSGTDYTIDNCYWDSSVNNTATNGIGSGTSENVTYRTDMKDDTFVTLLNSNAYNYNKSSAIEACAWKAESGDYPKLNFGADPGTTYSELSSITEDNIPTGTVWCITDTEGDTVNDAADFANLETALASAKTAGKEITLIFSNLTTLPDNAFDGCTALTSISLPSATSIGESAFNGCTSLTYVSAPLATSIGSNAFNGSTALTEISLPSATSIGYSAFNNCDELASISLPSAETIGANAFDGCDELTSLDLGSSGTGVTSIGENAFKDIDATAIDLTIKISGTDVSVGGVNNNELTYNTSTTTKFKSITLITDWSVQ